MGDRGRETWAEFGNVGLRQGNTAATGSLPQGAVKRSEGEGFPFLALSSKNGWCVSNFYSSRVAPIGAANAPRSWASLACAFFGQRDTV